MANWEKKTNNEIIIELNELKEKHEKLKNEILEKYNELERVERDFHDGKKIINTRVKGVK